MCLFWYPQCRICYYHLYPSIVGSNCLAVVFFTTRSFSWRLMVSSLLWRLKGHTDDIQVIWYGIVILKMDMDNEPPWRASIRRKPGLDLTSSFRCRILQVTRRTTSSNIAATFIVRLLFLSFRNSLIKLPWFLDIFSIAFDTPAFFFIRMDTLHDIVNPGGQKSSVRHYFTQYLITLPTNSLHQIPDNPYYPQ